MALVLTDDQLMIRDAARRFAVERVPLAQVRQLRDRSDAIGFDRAAWQEMAEMGWAGLLIPEEHGGVGIGLVAAGIVAEELGRQLSATPLLSTAVMSATALLDSGRAAHRQLLGRIAGGAAVVAFACDEQSRHAPYNVATLATASAGTFKLSGRKVHVFDAHIAERMIVLARTAAERDSRDGLTLFAVDAGAAGVKIQRCANVDGRNAATVELQDVVVSEGDVVGAVGGGARVLDKVLDAGRAVLAAELLGLSQEAFERTLSYLREREQFGVKIGTFQALQHRAAHLFCEIELLRSLVLRTLQALDAGEAEATGLACAAKAKAGEVARLATNEAVQMHGGIGMTDEFDIGFFMKRARTADATLGDVYYQADRFAQLAGY
jgi:acyl-CoA dehydrogenase